MSCEFDFGQFVQCTHKKTKREYVLKAFGKAKAVQLCVEPRGSAALATPPPSLNSRERAARL